MSESPALALTEPTEPEDQARDSAIRWMMRDVVPEVPPRLSITTGMWSELAQDLKTVAVGMSVDAAVWASSDEWFGEWPDLLARAPSSTTPAAPRKLSVEELIDVLESATNISFAAGMAERVRQLVEISQEEFPDQAPLKPESLQDFVAFLQGNPELLPPQLVITAEGNFRARWRKSRREHFALEFLGADDVRYVVFAADAQRPARINRASGTAHVATVMDLVAPHAVLRWASASHDRPAD